MKIQFNEAQLSRPQQQSLIKVLDVLQAQNKNELEVTAVEFPLKLMVKLDDDIGMLLGWDAEKKTYAGLTTLEPEHGTHVLSNETPPTLESEKDTVDLPEPESLTETKLEPELDLSPVLVRAEALALALVKLSMPLNTEQRLEIWMKFCGILVKELWK